MSTPSHYSLLVVDDEPDLRMLYELTLIREGYDVETAGTVEDAWARLSQPPLQRGCSPTCACPTAPSLDLLRRLYELTAGAREGGTRWITAATAGRGLGTRWQRSPTTPVISDMRLPDGSGLDLLPVPHRGGDGRSERLIVITA